MNFNNEAKKILRNDRKLKLKRNTLYDWEVPGKVLKIKDGGTPQNTVTLIFPEAFQEMYEKGFLTGKALEDAKKRFERPEEGS